MNVIRYFPLYILILLWVYTRSSKGEKSAEVTNYDLAVTRGWMENLLEQMEWSKPGPLQGWLINYLTKELEIVLTLQEVGMIATGVISRND